MLLVLQFLSYHLIALTILVSQGEDSTEPAAETKKPAEDFGLGVAQIVITAATPMTEEPDQPFPPPEEVVVNHTSVQEENEEPAGARSIITEPIMEEPEETEEADVKSIAEDVVAESAVVVSSSTGSDGETTGPSTAENSVSQALPAEDVTEPKQVVGGRASIPDELEPHQLACLQNLKESNA